MRHGLGLQNRRSPYPYATLDFRFAQGEFSSLITFTRASSATYFDSTGTLTTAANNVPRLDYDPATLAARGLLIEEQRVNSIRNNTMQGAVAGTPGTLPTNWNVDLSAVSGISRQIVGTGTENGITYIDIRLSGTSAVTATALILLDGNNAAAASPSQAWAVSSYVKLQAGSLTGIASTFLEIFEYSSVPAYLRQTSATTFTPTSSGLATQRVSGTVTTGASTAFTRGSVSVRFTGGVASDITLRIGLPQLEQGAFATSVIPTTGAAATRSVDVASVTTLTPWFNPAEGTLYGEGTVAYTVPGTFFPLLASFNDGTSSNRIETGYLTAILAGFEVVSGGSTQVGLYPSATTATRKVAGAYQVNNFAVSVNGGAASTDTLGLVPTVDRLRLGERTAGNNLNGWLRRITYYPRRLSNAELVSITS